MKGIKGGVYSCSCCGSDVTAPYFHKGGVYGYTCIKKVNPSVKRVKDAGLWVAIDAIEVVHVDADKNIQQTARRIQIIATVNGQRFSEVVRGSTDYAQKIMIAAKLMKVAESSGGKTCIWPNSFIRNEDNVDLSCPTIDPKKPLFLCVNTRYDTLVVAKCK